MAEFAALPIFTDAWIADTAHLSRAERGLYMDLLMLIWRSPECRVPADLDWVSRKLRCSPEERAMLENLIAEFCKSTGNWLTQKRLSQEFAFVREKREKQSDRAKSRWNKDKSKCHGNAEPHRSGNAPSPSPTPSIIRTSETSSEVSPKPVRTQYPEEFETFWKGYPTDANMSKKEALIVWKRLSPEKRAAAIASLSAFRLHCQSHPDYRPIHACRYLSKERFEGHVATAQKLEARRFIEQGTPQWDAWQDHLIRERGRGSPSTKGIVNGRSVSGWSFDSEWPPSFVIQPQRTAAE